MAVFQTAQARRKETPPAGYQSGVVMSQVVEFTFSAAYTAATDFVEMFMLPAGARLLSVRAIFANIGAVNTALGIVSGEFGSTDSARTVGTELFSAQTMVNGQVEVTTTNCLAVARDQTKHRGIGLKPAADIAAGGTKKVTLLVHYEF